MDCPSTATIRSLEVDWHFRVPSATWFVHQLGLNIRPEIREERFKFKDFEEDRKMVLNFHLNTSMMDLTRILAKALRSRDM